MQENGGYIVGVMFTLYTNRDKLEGVEVKKDFSYEDYLGKNDWIDYNYGVMFGWNITKKFGIFTEYEKTKFWDKNLMYLKAGLNWQL